MNSYRYFLGFVAGGIIFFSAACGGFEEPLTAADCFEDEYFDREPVNPAYITLQAQLAGIEI